MTSNLGRIAARSLVAVLVVTQGLIGSPAPVGASAAPAWPPLLDERLREVLPGVRPLLGYSWAGGEKPLLDLGNLAQGGEPNRIVIHAPYGDVNRDGTDDVLEMDLDLRQAHPQYGFIGILRLNTLSGRNGRVIGRYEMDFHSGVPTPVLARVGPKGLPGVIIVFDRFLTTPENPTYELDVRAATGRGRELWAREWTSTWTSTPTRFVAATGFAGPMGLLEHRGGKATDLLLGVYDYVGPVINLTPVVVSGADGSSDAHESVTLPWIETTPVAIDAPDMDGDERDDVVVVASTGLGQGLRANSSASGEELWHNSGAPAGTGMIAADVGDVTGNPVRDLVLGAPVRLIDGATGEIKWGNEKDEAVVWTYGDVDGDRRGDIFAMEFFADAKRFGVNADVITSKGRILAQRRYVGRRSASGWAWAIWSDAGDTNADGVGEAALHLLYYGEDLTFENRFVIDAVDARALHQGRDLFPLAGSLFGHGDDVAHVRREAGGFRVTVVEGSSGTSRWSATVKVRKDMELGFHPRAAGGSKRRRNIVMTFGNATGARVVLLDGRSGRPVWTRTLPPSTA